ncbi:MAG: beta-ketoacyl-ACP synthase II [Elusimicrobiaceae bacterium]
MKRKAVLTGTGIISPLGVGSAVSFARAADGYSGIRAVTLFDADDYPTRIAGEAADYKPDAYFDTKEQRHLTRFQQFALVAAREAVKESGLNMKEEDAYRVGVIIGSGVGSMQLVEEQRDLLRDKGPRRISPFLAPGIIINEAPALVAMELGAKGPNFSAVTACASGAHSIGAAIRAIQYGDADVVVAGGTEATVCPICFAAFCALRAMSTRNDSPAKASRPFSATRDGFVMGEGAGIVVLEELEHARNRGANILAEAAGYGATNDAYHITAPDPSGDAGTRCMELAMRDAGLLPADIGYINAHGTSTPMNDAIETTIIKKALGEHVLRVAVSSTKSVTGHMIGAAGAVGFIFSALAVKNGILPPTINLDDPDPACDLDYVPNHSRKADINAALCNSFGFGGHNACLAVRKYK